MDDPVSDTPQFGAADVEALNNVTNAASALMVALNRAALHFGADPRSELFQEASLGMGRNMSTLIGSFLMTEAERRA